MIDFNTREYEFSHGHKPRGRGSWAFFFAQPRDGDEPYFTPGSTIYAEAKKMAVAEAKRRFGANAAGTIYVGS